MTEHDYQLNNVGMGLTWSGRWHVLKEPQHTGALCGASPYEPGEEPHHLKQMLAEGQKFPICKKCTTAKEKLS